MHIYKKIIAFFMLQLMASAGFSSVGISAEIDNTIRIQADALEADIEGNTAEFTGNVRIDRGEARITTDYLKLYYHRDQKSKNLQQLDASAVDKIEARGNVRIRYQDMTAQANEATYTPKADTLILEGRNTRVAKAGYALNGSRLVLNGASNNLTAVGDGRTRVKAVITTDKDLF